MSYKTILVHVDQSRHAAARIRLAARIAVAENAHLVGAAMTGAARLVYQSSAIAYALAPLAVNTDFLYLRANLALSAFEQLAAELGVASFEKRLIDDEAEDGMVVQARYADLVVLGQHDPQSPDQNAGAGLAEYVLLNCARPLLIVPHAGHFERVGARPLVAWDGGAAATRALHHALPLLRRAELATLALLNPSRLRGVHGQEPGADIALHLARHGVALEVLQRDTDIDIGNALLSMAAERDADLLVMGGYGHARFREVLLGGATRTILNTMTVPVLMSH